MAKLTPDEQAERAVRLLAKSYERAVQLDEVMFVAIGRAVCNMAQRGEPLSFDTLLFTLEQEREKPHPTLNAAGASLDLEKMRIDAALTRLRSLLPS